MIKSTGCRLAAFVVLSCAAGFWSGACFTAFAQPEPIVARPEVIWKFSEDSVFEGAPSTVPLSIPIVADGVVYLGDENGKVSALRAENGEVLWQKLLGGRITTEPAVDEENVYVASETGIACARRDSGELIWRRDIAHGVTGTTPIRHAERLIVAANDGKVYSMDRNAGEIVWTHDFAIDAPPDKPGFKGEDARFQKIFARPSGSACDGKIIVQCVFDQSRTIALDCETGKRLWTFQSEGWMSGSPTIAGDQVFVSSQDAHLYCLNRATGALIWKFKTPDWISSNSVVRDGKVYLTHHRGRLYVLDAESGAQLRLIQPMDEIEGGSLHASDPILQGDIAYYATYKGELYAVDIESGGVRWKMRPSAESELLSLITDGRRFYLCARRDYNKKIGESAIVAVGNKP